MINRYTQALFTIYKVFSKTQIKKIVLMTTFMCLTYGVISIYIPYMVTDTSYYKWFSCLVNMSTTLISVFLSNYTMYKIFFMFLP